MQMAKISVYVEFKSHRFGKTKPLPSTEEKGLYCVFPLLHGVSAVCGRSLLGNMRILMQRHSNEMVAIVLFID